MTRLPSREPPPDLSLESMRGRDGRGRRAGSRRDGWPRDVPPPFPSVTAPRRRRLRILAWRLRFVLAACCVATAVALVTEALRPSPGAWIYVAGRDLPAGSRLTAADVRAVAVPASAGLAGSGSDETRAALLGSTVAVAVPAGLPLVPELIAGADLAGPPGTVVAAVRLADPALVALLAPGDRVDVLAAPLEGGPAVTVARGALVLPWEPEPAGGPLDLGDGPAPLLVAVTPDEAAALAGAGASSVLAAVVVR